MARNTDTREIEKTSTKLGKKTSFRGVMRFTDSVMISGNFEGEIHSTGFLYIDYGAVVHADIKVRTVIIGGVVHGNIEAADTVEMLPSGQVYGNIRASKLKIADGVVFEGKCEMIRNADAIDIFSAPVTELKKVVQSVT
jgi:cytoskeletal protein CcmA (bactofilin family)